MTKTKKEIISKNFTQMTQKVELEKFFKDCMNACEKEILKSHEMQPLDKSEDIQNSFFFELRRKHFLA